jgi:hypothetical protein
MESKKLTHYVYRYSKAGNTRAKLGLRSIYPVPPYRLRGPNRGGWGGGDVFRTK